MQIEDEEYAIKIPIFATEEELAEFWDTHSTADYLDEWQEVELEWAPDEDTCPRCGGQMPQRSREPPSMRFILQCIRNRKYRLTEHATFQRLARDITTERLEAALLSGEIIEREPDNEPYPSCLVLGWLESGDPLHVKCSRGTREPKLRIVTVYEPDEDKWEADFKTRKR